MSQIMNPLAVYQAALAGHWLVMGLKTNISPIDAWMSKMEATIENIASLATVGNLAINQLMERRAAMAVIAKATFTEEPKRTMMMAKNVCQVVSWVVETLANMPKQEERKLNLRFTGFEAKKGETEKELVQRLNTKLLQGQMRLCAKVVVTTQERPAIARASTLAVGRCHNIVLLKFATNKDHQAALRRRKGLAGSKLGLDKDLTPTQQACKSKLWPLFKEAKVVGKRTFWRTTELFINDTQIFPPSFI
jgi:hypothetical protein